MNRTNRRAFLSDVGRGMLAAGLGTSLANDLGFSTAFANEGSDAIPLGEYDSLVELMRSTPAEKLQPMLAQMVVQGRGRSEEADRGRRLGQCRHVRRVRLCRIPHRDGHAAGAGDEPHAGRSPPAAAGAEGAVSQFAADPKRRRRVKSHARGDSCGRACLRRRRRHPDSRRLPQGGRRAGREAAGRRGRLAARGIQRPATGDPGRSQRPPIRVCPSNLRTGRLARRRVFVLDAAPMRPALRRSRTRSHRAQAPRVADSRAGAEAARPVQAGRQEARQARSGRCRRR